MTRKLPFIFPIIPDQSSSKVLDSFKKIQLSHVQVQHQNDKCKHCNRVGHKENQCFDLHPCQNCGKHNHSSDKCSTLKKPARLKIHYEWIDPWKWSSTTKRLYKSYRRIQSRVKTNLVAHNIFVPHISGPLMA
jgi:hypothetical protein